MKSDHSFANPNLRELGCYQLWFKYRWQLGDLRLEIIEVAVETQANSDIN